MKQEPTVFDGEFYNKDGTESELKSTGKIDRELSDSMANFIEYSALFILVLILLAIVYFYATCSNCV